MTTPLPPLPRDQRKIDADHLNLLAIFHFVGAGLAVLGILFLVAGCATRNSSPAALGSNQVPVMVTSAGAGIATNPVEKSAIPHQLQAKARPRQAPLNNTPFNGYDSAIVEAIGKKWYALLDGQKFTKDRLGKVVVGFHLHPDGTVSDVKSL
jgi:hypothetical protein